VPHYTAFLLIEGFNYGSLKFLFQWSVQSQSNGLYTIRNTGTRLYLAGSASNLVEGAHLIGQSTTFEWSIQTFGPGVNFL